VCSLYRSGGDRGADIETLRGTNGPDFEGYAVINRADGAGVCCTCGGGKDLKEKILLVKGPFCFVFNKETDSSPKYAISLAHMKAVMQPSSNGMHHVTIETSLGDVEWELSFKQTNIAKQFVDTFKEQAAIGEADEVRKVRTFWYLFGSCMVYLTDIFFGTILHYNLCIHLIQRLGHEQLLQKRASTKYAAKVATKKIEDQPEKRENAVMEEMNREERMMAVGY
jgi:hypothetical protein